MYGVNEFSDWTVEEFRSTIPIILSSMRFNYIIICTTGQYLSGLQHSGVVATKVHSSKDVDSIPMRFDW